MKVILAVSFAVFIGGCTETKDYFDGSKVVTVDGVEIAVAPMENVAGGYRAVPNYLDLSQVLLGYPGLTLKNIEAIEMVTGCPVNRNSVGVHELSVAALVDCPA